MTSETLKLTDFMDLSALQEIQDGFASIASVQAIFTDAEGKTLTNPNPTSGFLHRRDALASQEEQIPEPQRVGREYIAPIVIADRKLGQIRMKGGSDHVTIDDDKAQRLAKKFGVDPQVARDLVQQATKDRNRRPAAVQFLFLLANAIARLCYQEYQLRHRVIEVETLSRVTTMLAQAIDLRQVLDRATEIVTELTEARACSIRLLNAATRELAIQSVYNLSPEYLGKGAVKLDDSRVDLEALSETGFSYVADMRSDERVIYNEMAEREGLISMLTVGIKSRGEPIGVMRIYSGQTRKFSSSEITLLRGIAATAGSAIEKARLVRAQNEARQIEEQINLAADVQQRMIPRNPPRIPGIELAASYVPCYQLGGDLYDFIELPYNNLGVVIADVSGKGLPASLIMASVRAALRAQVDNVYYLDEVLRRLNSMLVRDTRDTEFVSLFYGVIDTRNRRFTYCNAGHLPALLLRNGQVHELGSGEQGSIVLGVIENERFKQSFIDIQPGDALLLHTDGLNEARNRQDQQFGRDRVAEVYRHAVTGSSEQAPPTTAPNADAIARRILRDHRAFTAGAPPVDDITVVCVRFQPT